MNKYLDTVVVCPLTSTIHPNWRSRLQIICQKKEAEIAVDQIRCISKLRILNKISSLTKKQSQKLRQIIREMYTDI